MTVQIYRLSMNFNNALVLSSSTSTAAVERTLSGHCEVTARTRGDAIMQAQKEAARRWGLTRTEECLVRVEFI